ncbi:ATP/GTP binding protein [Hysterangium stoloniferum]|nr:ATP/GTP binding protein [Hysterangium stoloniferum]
METRIQRHFHDDKCAKFGLVLSENGYWNDTEALQRKVLEMRGKVFGEKHPQTLIIKYSLATSLATMKELQEAEKLGIEVGETQKDVMGHKAPEMLQKLQVQVVKARTKIRGSNHPETLVSMHNLASTLRQQGELKKADKLGKQVLEARKALFGKYQDRLEEAAEMQSRVVKLRKEILGLERLSTLRSMYFLAVILQQQGKLEVAKELELVAVQGLRRAAGAENQHTVQMMKVLLKIFQNEGNITEVEKIQAELEEIKNHKRSDAMGASRWKLSMVSTFFHQSPAPYNVYLPKLWA